MTAPCPMFGFDVRVVLDDGLSNHRAAVVREHFVHEVVEKNALVCTGGGTHEWRYTISREGEQATHVDRQTVSAWLSARGEIADYDVGPLVDLR